MSSPLPRWLIRTSVSMASAASCACLAQGSDAPASSETSVVSLEPVVVTATRRPTAALSTPATVTVIGDTQIQETLVSDFHDLFRYEPGIAVKREPRGRGGEAGLEVRGIGGQRLGMLVDGVRLPGGYAAAGANLGQMKLEPLSLGRVEVLRGPASSFYGSDALAGVALFTTLSPSDFLTDDRTFAGNASVGYDGADHSRYTNTNLAFRAGVTRNLISLTERHGHELANHGDSTLQPNPQDGHGHNVLLKSIIDLGIGQNLTLTGEHYEQKINTNQISLAVPIAGGTRINSSIADDRSTRSRFGAAYAYSPQASWFDNLKIQLDYQRSTSQERTAENRKPPGAAPVLLRDTLLSYREPQWSGSLQLDGQHSSGPVMHRWVAGVDLLSKSVSLYNDALQRTAAGTGATNVIDGDVYPRKIAPDTDVRSVGVFVQDEMAFDDGRFKLTPSLRYDHFKLSPQPDALFANANVAGNAPVSLSKDALTPRLGLSYEWQPRQVAYANYVTGFRMPTYDQLNRVGQVPVATFIHDFVPAPNLKPEKSKGVELGFKGEGTTGSYEIAAFYNRYEDFIDTQMIAFIPAGPTVGPRPIRRFQSRNIGEVEIYGLEARGRLALTPLLQTTDRWNLIGALQWSMGSDKTNDQPINSIQPAKLVAGLRWDQRGGQYGGQLIGNFVAAKKRVNTALTQTGSTAPVPLTTAGYTTVDLTAYVRLGKQTTLNLAVFNLLDRKYFDWSTVSALSGNDTRLAAYTAPGRTVSASLKVDF